MSAAGSELFYSGNITFEANRRLFELAVSLAEAPSTLVITSNGGDIVAGMELGRWLFESGMDVRVPEYCVSSCANYVFVAGRRKVLAPEAALMWHGGATQRFEVDCDSVEWQRTTGDCDEEELRELMVKSMSDLIAQETAFFSDIGVDQRITIFGQQPMYACARRQPMIGWYYSIADLESMGVDRIQVLGDEWRPTTRSRSGRMCRVDLRR